MDAFKRAYDYVKREGRPLDQARLAYAFEQGSKDAVLEALSHYQEADGGFSGLEPDFSADASTPIDTWMAINIVRELDLPTDHNMTSRICDYLEQTSDQDAQGYYYFATLSMQKADHAPWWHTEKNRVEGFNPTASLVAFYHQHRGGTPKTHAIIQKAIEHIATQKQLEMHEWRALMEMVLTLPKATQQDLQPSLKRHLETFLPELERWRETYTAGPVELFFHPQCLTWCDRPLPWPSLIQSVKDNLHPKGYVPIRWQWEGARFEEAQRHWHSLLTTQTLLWLNAFQGV